MFIIDVETTGLNPQKHSLVSIGIVDYCSPEREPFYAACRAWNGAEIDHESLKINGFSEEEVRNKNPCSLQEAVDHALAYIDICPIKIPAGMNIGRLDIPMMVNACERSGREWFYEKYSVDLHAVVLAHFMVCGLNVPLDRFGKSALGSSAIHGYVGLPPEPRPHHALTGAKMEAEAFSRVLTGKGLLPEFEQYPMPAYLERT